MNHPYAAYQNAYQTVSKTRQIVMLYEGTIRFLQQAREAMDSNRIEERYHLLIKASDVIIGLQSCLDFDADKQVAHTLFDFYADIDMRIMQLQRSNNIEECNAIIDELKGMRDIWKDIDEKTQTQQKNAVSQPEISAQSQQSTDTSHAQEMQNGVFVSA